MSPQLRRRRRHTVGPTACKGQPAGTAARILFAAFRANKILFRIMCSAKSDFYLPEITFENSFLYLLIVV